MMLQDGTLLRLFVSQAFALYFILLLLPLKKPGRRSVFLILLGAFVIIMVNALIIMILGISFYIRYYLLTLTVPYILLGLHFAAFKGAKFVFVILTVQVIGNVAILNGLLASYLFYGENNPFIDTAARALTYIIFLPVLLTFIRPTYMMMTEVIKKGWWVLNGALMVSYALAYFILFVPDAVFNRPLYFFHAYIGMVLSLFIYAIIFYLFIEIQTKIVIERDKLDLTTQVSSLTKETEAMTLIAHKDALTGLKNRYALFQEMKAHIDTQRPFLIVFIDLNNLKLINDAYDHSTGDAYLTQLARALNRVVGDQGQVYRFAGDEFICLITHEPTRFNAKDFKAAVATNMVMAVPYYGMSLGIARYPSDGLNADDLIKQADQAMYVDKRAYVKRK